MASVIRGSDAFDTAATLRGIQLGTVVATTSGSAIDITGIPSGVKRLILTLFGVSNASANSFIIQLGDSGGIETSGYISSVATSGGGTTATTGLLLIRGFTPSSLCTGQVILSLQNPSTNAWVETGTLIEGGTRFQHNSTGHKALSGELTSIRLTMLSSDTFDAGSINLSWEY